MTHNSTRLAANGKIENCTCPEHAAQFITERLAAAGIDDVVTRNRAAAKSTLDAAYKSATTRTEQDQALAAYHADCARS